MRAHTVVKSRCLRSRNSFSRIKYIRPQPRLNSHLTVQNRFCGFSSQFARVSKIPSFSAHKTFLNCMPKPSLTRSFQTSKPVMKWHPVHTAASLGWDSILPILLWCKLSPDVPHNGQTPLFIASSKGRLKTALILLDHHANPSSINIGGATPLHAACSNQHPKIVQALLDRAANPNIQDSSGDTPLHIVAQKGNIELLDLLTGSNVELQNQKGQTPLLIAAEQGHFQVIQTLLEVAFPALDQTDQIGMTALHYCIQNSNLESAKLLLAKGANPNVPNISGSTPLNSASLSGDLQAIELLLSHKADQRGDLNGMYPIHSASLNGDYRVVHLLLKNGANPNQTHNDRFTPLHVASLKGHVQVVDILLSHDADPNRVDKNSISPLMIACKHGQVAVVKKLLLAKADPNKADRFGRTALMHAINFGSSQIVELLLLSKADPSKTDQLGRTPLQKALNKIPEDNSLKEEYIKIVALLK